MVGGDLNGDDDPDLAVMGYGYGRVLTLLGAIRPAPGFSVTPDRKDFGVVAAGATATQTFTVTNSGKADLTVSTAALVGRGTTAFATAADGCSGTTLTPGGTCAVDVTYTPSSDAPTTATLRFVHDASTSPDDVPLTAGRTVPPTVPPTPTPPNATGRCGGLVATLVGTPGDDVLRGTPDRDVVVGLGGDDTILGLGGGDRLCGGTGDDRVVGGAGDDVVLGGLGDDRLTGGAGDDRVFGRSGDDRLRGGRGDDRMRGGAGDDRFIGGAGYDRCHGGPGRDVASCEWRVSAGSATA